MGWSVYHTENRAGTSGPGRNTGSTIYRLVRRCMSDTCVRCNLSCNHKLTEVRIQDTLQHSFQVVTAASAFAKKLPRALLDMAHTGATCVKTACQLGCKASCGVFMF